MPVTTLRKQLKVVEIARPRQNRRPGPFGGWRHRGGGRPPARPNLSRYRSIQVNNRQLRDVIADAWAAIHAINEPGARRY